MKFDVSDDHFRVAWVSWSDRVVHLHPRLLSRPTPLHELAHWVDGRDGLGARFQATYVTFVEVVIGRAEARALLETLREYRLQPDIDWLPTGLLDPEHPRRGAALLVKPGADRHENDTYTQ